MRLFIPHYEFDKNANSINVGTAMLVILISLATIGVCVFCAVTSVAALFIFGGPKMKTKAERILCIALALCICLTILPNVTRQVAAADPINMMIAYAQDRLGKTGSRLEYGNEPWCAYFVSDCAAYAGQSGAIPKHGNAHSLYFLVRDAGGTPVSSPQAGDLIFYNCPASDTTGDGISIMHVGLVAYDGYTIEGNRSGEVKRQKLTDSFRDEHGHSTTTGAVTRLYLRPAYSGQTPHTHSYTGARVYENAHPHRISQRCVDYASCGGWIWTDDYNELKTCEQCWHADFHIGASSISVKAGESKTVSASLSGCLPDTAVMTREFSPDNDVVEVTVSNQQMTFTGLKAGTTNFSLTVYSDSSKSRILGTVTIPVTVTPSAYTISYNANGGSGAPDDQTKYHGTILTLSSTTPTRSGYTFMGWSTSSTATSASYQAGGHLMTILIQRCMQCGKKDVKPEIILIRTKRYLPRLPIMENCTAHARCVVIR